MFYSETLLSKTGPLARVWLAANIERKLTKKDVLSSGIERSVHAIVDQGQAPMALRLSGQLLLGVVRIYSRKARYLLDDCNEALLKIKMAFKPGNVDLPSTQSHSANTAALTLPDVLTELDLMAPMPDPELLLAELDPSARPLQQDPTLLDWGSSQLLTESLPPSLSLEEPLALEEDDLGLDITDVPADTTIMEVEQGRRAPSIARGMEEEFALAPEPSKLLEDDGLELDLGEEIRFDDDTTFMAPPLEEDSELPPLIHAPSSPQSIEAHTPAPMEEAARIRDSVSPPLSSIHSSDDRELTAMLMPGVEGEGEAPAKPTHRPKRRRILQADTTTEMTTQEVRAQTQDRSGILRPVSFLPRDPLMLNLMQLHQEGSFAAAFLGEGRMSSWAPELRDIFSIDALRQTGELKRKRLSDVSEISEVPALEFEDEEIVPPFGAPEELPSDIFGLPGDTTEMVEVPRPSVEPTAEDEGRAEEEEAAVRLEFSDEEPLTPVGELDEPFDETTMPILHPADSGSIAVATKRVVHELRDRFGGYVTDPGAVQPSIMFTDLAPERAATKVDATRMFFEMLVLATKDAIKVEQSVERGEIGEPIRIRAKRGLWGAWAEESASGGLDGEEETAEAELRGGGGGDGGDGARAQRGLSKVMETPRAGVSVVPASPQHV